MAPAGVHRRRPFSGAQEWRGPSLVWRHPISSRIFASSQIPAGGSAAVARAVAFADRHSATKIALARGRLRGRRRQGSHRRIGGTVYALAVVAPSKCDFRKLKFVGAKFDSARIPFGSKNFKILKKKWEQKRDPLVFPNSQAWGPLVMAPYSVRGEIFDGRTKKQRGSLLSPFY